MLVIRNAIFVIAAVFLVVFFVAPISTFSQSAASVNTDTDAEILQLQSEIAQKQKELTALEARQAEYQEQIRAAHDEQTNLKNQIATLNTIINKTEVEIQTTQLNIDKTNLEIRKVELEIRHKTEDIAKKKDYLESLLRLMAQNDGKDMLEVLLVNSSLSDFLEQVQYLQSLNTNMGEALETVKDVKLELESENEALDKKKKELEGLKEKLEGQKAVVGDQKNSKQNVLDRTKQSEREFQRLLNAAKAEQNTANAAIVTAEQAIRAKLLEKNGKDSLTFDDKGFSWPVPKNVITAYFHDPDYPYRYVFEHPAIDIRAAQGTVTRAAASGYVAKAVDNGYGYSYIMIVHGDGLSTVYGHVSRIDVAIDQFVAQGQAIGLSGGMPGSRGAGYLTSGPHMHFEVRLNGIPVNPLSYLP